MNEPALLALAVSSGGALGVIFFAGLWWTVRRGLASTGPALWFLGSLWLRSLIVVAGFLAVAQGDWRRLAGCVVGFMGARAAVARWALRTGGPR